MNFMDVASFSNSFLMVRRTVFVTSLLRKWAVMYSTISFLSKGKCTGEGKKQGVNAGSKAAKTGPLTVST